VCLQVEKELRDICNDMLEVLEKHLIPSANSGESKVFYFKMYILFYSLSFYRIFSTPCCFDCWLKLRGDVYVRNYSIRSKYVGELIQLYLLITINQFLCVLCSDVEVTVSSDFFWCIQMSHACAEVNSVQF